VVVLNVLAIAYVSKRQGLDWSPLDSPVLLLTINKSTNYRTTLCFIKRTLFCFFHSSLKWWSLYTKFVSVVAEKIIQNMAVDWIFFASCDVTLTCVMGTSLIVSTGHCQLLPCSDGEKSGLPMTIFWSFIVAATKTCKAIAFTWLWG